MSFSVAEFRKNFPQLERNMGPNPFIYFDNGASTLKHSRVTDRLNSYNRFEVANVHRGAHQVSRLGTESYEGARQQVADLIGAEQNEVIFTRGTTESINLVAHIISSQLNEGDEILITPFEHHSNIVPWQELCNKKGCVLKVVAFDEKTGVSTDQLMDAISEKTKIFAMIHYSNSFGQRLPIETFIRLAQEKNILTLVDGAQAILTEPIDVKKLDCDFYTFSGHKMYGPYGIGALYGKKNLLDALPPYQTGGSMIDRVSFAKTTYAQVPQKYEAGTPNISGAIGLGAAAEIVSHSDYDEQHKAVIEMRNFLKLALSQMSSYTVYDFESQEYAGILSFNHKGAHPSDVGTLLDKYGFAVRAGHHCTQPLMDLMGISGTVRASFAPYNTMKEVERFVMTLEKIEEFF